MTNQQGAPEALYAAAMEFAAEKASISYVQRKCRCSWNDAEKMLERMVREGIIATYGGRKSAALVEAQQPAPSAAAFDEHGFRDWVLRNMPDDTIIGSSAWWADHLTAWAKRFVNAAPQPSPTPQADSAPVAAPADTVVLEAALRAIHQAIDLIGEPDTERLRTVRRVLRGAVVVAEDSTAPQADSQPAVQQWNDLIGKETHADADGLLFWRDEVDFAIPTPQADSQPAPTYSIDADAQGIRARVAEAITGALAFGAQGTNSPPAGHWLAPFWDAANADRAARAPADSVTAPAGGVVAARQGAGSFGRPCKVGGPCVASATSACACSELVDTDSNDTAAAPTPPAQAADSVLEDADPIRALIAEHAAVLDQNESAYFELCYHRATGWMAWITDKPLCMPPVVNPDRKVLAQGQGDTADEACRDAARKQGGA